MTLNDIVNRLMRSEFRSAVQADTGLSEWVKQAFRSLSRQELAELVGQSTRSSGSATLFDFDAFVSAMKRTHGNC